MHKHKTKYECKRLLAFRRSPSVRRTKSRDLLSVLDWWQEPVAFALVQIKAEHTKEILTFFD